MENPFRHGAFGRLVKKVRSGEASLPDWLRTHAVPAVGAGALVIVAAGGLALVPPTSALEGGDLLKQAEQGQTSPSGQAQADPSGQPLAEESPQEPEGSAPVADEQPKLDVLMIGDSVSVRSVPYFQERFPHGAIDAAVNRQIYVGREVYDSYRDQGLVGGIVVLALGTNGPATDGQLDDIVADVGTDKQLWLVNTRSPQDWVSSTNDVLAGAAERYGNVHLIDWFGASAGRDELFDGDGTHLTEEGARVYIDLVHDAVASYLPQHAEDAAAPAVQTPIDLALAEIEGAYRSALDAASRDLLGSIER